MILKLFSNASEFSKYGRNRLAEGKLPICAEMCSTKALLGGDGDMVSNIYRERVVARGFLQSPWDVGETHSNVAKLSTVRALLSKAAVKDWDVRQLDVQNAYLCADIASEHVFCSPPEGQEKPGYVMYLQKALYGLKNSAKAWFDTFAETLKGLGYTQSHFDDCLWEYKNESENKFIFITCLCHRPISFYGCYNSCNSC